MTHATWATTATVPRHVPPVLPDSLIDAAGALILSGSPFGPPSLLRGLLMLAEVLDCEPSADEIRGAIGHAGARAALVTAARLAQHGTTFDVAASDEGDGTVLASFLSLTVATARLIRGEDDDVSALGEPYSGPETGWRGYVERAGRVALVRSLRAVSRLDPGPSGRDSLYRVPTADDPSVTAPRAPRTSRSPGAKVANVPRSRSERRRDVLARAAAVTADALGGDLPPLVTFGQAVAGDPVCPLYVEPSDRQEGDPVHTCSPGCFGLGGMHEYSPRQGRAHVPPVAGPMVPTWAHVLPVGVPVQGPYLVRDEAVTLAWRPFRMFPDGVAYRRGHDVDTAAATLPDKSTVRLVWRPSTARQYVTADGKRYTPGTWSTARVESLRIPPRTAAYLANGGTFDSECVTVYQGTTFVGNGPATRPDEVTVTRAATKRQARVKRAALTVQQRAVITLLTDAVTLVMFDGRPRTPHPGYVVTRTGAGVLSLLTPQGIQTPLPNDPRKVTATIRAAIITQ